MQLKSVSKRCVLHSALIEMRHPRPGIEPVSSDLIGATLESPRSAGGSTEEIVLINKLEFQQPVTRDVKVFIAAAPAASRHTVAGAARTCPGEHYTTGANSGHVRASGS